MNLEVVSWIFLGSWNPFLKHILAGGFQDSKKLELTEKRLESG